MITSALITTLDDSTGVSWTSLNKEVLDDSLWSTRWLFLKLHRRMISTWDFSYNGKRLLSANSLPSPLFLLWSVTHQIGEFFLLINLIWVSIQISIFCLIIIFCLQFVKIIPGFMNNMTLFGQEIWMIC